MSSNTGLDHVNNFDKSQCRKCHSSPNNGLTVNVEKQQFVENNVVWSTCVREPENNMVIFI